MGPHSWQPLGPWDISGRIKCLAIDPIDGNIVYAGSASGGVWITEDGGQTWRSLMSDRGQCLAIGAIAVDPRNRRVLYVATGEDTGPFGPSYPGDGLYRYQPWKPAWKHVAPLKRLPCMRCTRILIHPNDGTVFVGGESGLYRSTGTLKTWVRLRLSGHVTDAFMDPADPDRLFAAIWNQGVYRSQDGGDNWEPLYEGILTGPCAGWIKIAYGSGADAASRFVAAKMGECGDLVFGSTDGGDTWDQLPGRPTASDTPEWANMLAVNPRNNRMLFAGAVDLQKSSDGGLNFNPREGIHADNHAIVFDPVRADRCYLATDGGVYVSLDGGDNWRPTTGQPPTTQFYSVGVSQTEPVHFGGVTQDLNILIWDGMGNWAVPSVPAENGRFAVDPSNSSICYAISNIDDATTLWKSVDGGRTFDYILAGGGGVPPNRIRDLAVNPSNPRQLVCAADRLIRYSPDGGVSWSSGDPANDVVTRIAFCPARSQFCYALTMKGEVFGSKGSGAPGTWQPAGTPNLRLIDPFSSSLAVSWQSPRRIYLAINSRNRSPIYRSANGGETLEDASGSTGRAPLPEVEVNDLAVDPEDDDTVYAATEIGVFVSYDRGEHWRSFNKGLPKVDTSGLAIRKTGPNPSTYELYASTMGRGVFSCTV